MIYPLLPVYLSQVLGAGAVSLGVIEGVAEGVNSGLRVVSGALSDRWARRKPLTILGYALSSVARPLIALTSSWPQVLGIRALDRTGKGLRGAPRDALLAQFAEPSSRGRIFGVHRAMDHAGAVVGPLIAALVLLWLPGHYRLLFALTTIPGAIAVAILFFVSERAPVREIRRRATGVGAESPAPARLPRPFFALMGVLLVFSLGCSADAFLLLRLSAVLGRDAYVPLLWALLHVVKAGLSVVGGAWSDRVGRKGVIVAGWCVYAAVYWGFAVVDDPAALVACFLAYGAYFGLAEGSEKALIADLAPAARRGTAFGYYHAITGVGALVASVAFGALYEYFGSATAFATGAALAAIAAVLLIALPLHVEPDRGAHL